MREREGTGQAISRRGEGGAEVARHGAVVDVFPFVVLYRIDEKRHAVIIVAVAHTRRRPGYWRGRR